MWNRGLILSVSTLMYCPSCGSEERQLSQFCRACGTDLRVVRTTLEQPDAITASAASAREQVAMAVADKIRQMETARDLETVAEDVLPHLEKFLESPEEKRLRRIRAGVIAAAVGLATTIVTVLMALDKSDIAPFIAPCFVTLLVGLGVVINGVKFTLPRKTLPGDFSDAQAQKKLDSAMNRLQPEGSLPRMMTNELAAVPRQPAPSITEHTTHHLSQKKS